MEKCSFTHGGKSYDEKYPEGIPTSISVTFKGNKKYDSGFVMFPSGHSRNSTANLKEILNYKNNLLGKIALSEKDLNIGEKYMRICLYIQAHRLLILYSNSAI